MTNQTLCVFGWNQIYMWVESTHFNTITKHYRHPCQGKCHFVAPPLSTRPQPSPPSNHDHFPFPLPFSTPLFPHFPSFPNRGCFSKFNLSAKVSIFCFWKPCREWISIWVLLQCSQKKKGLRGVLKVNSDCGRSGREGSEG